MSDEKRDQAHIRYRVGFDQERQLYRVYLGRSNHPGQLICWCDTPAIAKIVAEAMNGKWSIYSYE